MTPIRCWQGFEELGENAWLAPVEWQLAGACKKGELCVLRNGELPKREDAAHEFRAALQR